LRRQIRAEAEATLDKALSRARQEAVQALRRAVLSLIAVVLSLFALGYASFAAFVFLRGEIGPLWAASAIAGLLFVLALLCIGFAAVLGRKPGKAADKSDADDDAADDIEADAPPVVPIETAAATPPPPRPASSDPADPRAEAQDTLQAVMTAVSDEVENDTARAVLLEGTRHVRGLSGVQLGLLAAATGFVYAQSTPRRPRRR
ncbi:MAG: phage holin family protein, partial [Pseudomonadota bacterium]